MKKISRLNFIFGTIIFSFSAGILAFISQIKRLFKLIKTKQSGPDWKFGHRLLIKIPSKIHPIKEIKTSTLILGGGISGLSAAWKLLKNGYKDFILLEMENESGGNARGGITGELAYPTGAHYLPMPTRESSACSELLRDLGIIIGYNKKNLPIIREEYLLHEKRCRIFVHNKWQDGEYPLYGSGQKGITDLKNFIRLMEKFKKKRGKDNKKAFAIPIDYSSRDHQFLKLDKISMTDFLIENGFQSPKFAWYINNAMKDDYGGKAKEISAWMGIHYFASRDSNHANSKEDGEYLVWPEGNAFLSNAIYQYVKKYCITNTMIRKISIGNSQVRMYAQALPGNQFLKCSSKYVIYAMPLFQLPFLINDKKKISHLRPPEMSPWLVANLFLENIPQKMKDAFSWDNLLYDSESLGYVVANHQNLRTNFKQYILTYYLPLPVENRSFLLETDDESLKLLIQNDLKKAHPDLEKYLVSMEFTRRAHAMAIPRKGTIWDGRREQNQKIIGGLIPAHSDLAGYSIFEEANYYGVKAAEVVLKKENVPFTSSI